MKKLLILVPILLNGTLVFADQVTGGSIGLLKVTTGYVDSTRRYDDKMNGNMDIIAATMTSVISQLNNVANSTGTLALAVSGSTNAFATGIAGSTNSFALGIVNSTNSMRTDIAGSTNAFATGIANSTNTMRTEIASSTGSFATGIAASTAAFATGIANSTAAMRTEIYSSTNSIGIVFSSDTSRLSSTATWTAAQTFSSITVLSSMTINQSLVVKSSFTVVSGSISVKDFTMVFSSAPSSGQKLSVLSVSGQNIYVGGGGDNAGSSGGGGGISGIAIYDVAGQVLQNATTIQFSDDFVVTTAGSSVAVSLADSDVTTGTIARFEFSENLANSTFQDSIITTRTGTLYSLNNGVVRISTGINFTRAISIGNSTGSAGIPDDSWMSYHQGGFTVGQMAISFWVYPRQLDADRYFFYKGNADGTSYEYIWYYSNATDKLNFTMYTSAGSGVTQFLSSAAVLNANNWNHIVYVVDKTQASGSKSWMYVNNNRMSGSSSDTSGTTSNTGSQLVIGKAGEGTTGMCDCILDKVKFYNRVLTASNVDDLFKEKKR